ncbi:MAG TPA: type I-C CRISPR-associated protein Cas8c/Csd1 [Candidatus Marinimicrobia bacterium]|nr:type I-C CRISPR-associated protein Cas8c/Csd1 [Candidatus Neomarinimicrobiota bacterium]
MGFWQHLAESYDKNADAFKKTYPLSTTTISNNGDMIIIIVIDGNGKFIRYDKIEKKSNPSLKSPGNPLVNITIPVTEESMGRSSGISPHPIFDQYEYLKGEGKKYDAYMGQLKDFSESSFSTEKVKAIYNYIKKKTVASDLSEIGIKDKTNIIFQVEIQGQLQSKVWEDEIFFYAWHQYYLDIKAKRAEEKKKAQKMLTDKLKLSSGEKKQLKEQTRFKDAISLDYIEGNDKEPAAIFHPKKISIRNAANAKLVSDNDDENYTFRGKFEDSSQAVSIGYESSQKAHQFLRYLINDRGYYCGEQVILSFTIGSTEKLLPPPVENDSLSAIIHSSGFKTENDIQTELRANMGLDYAEALRKSLDSFKYGNTLEKHAKTAVIALDASTKGRLSITFYRELDRNEYLERIADWHEGCKWKQQFWDKENQKFVFYIGAPSVDKIIEAVHGKPRGGEDKSYTKIKKAARERLLRCIFDGAFLPMDFVIAALRRVSNPLGITKQNKFDRNRFEQVVSTACALVRKDYKQRKKEDYKLSIELDRTDRDYLYGRLLGAADKLEEYALYKQGKDRMVTAAIRHMQAFTQHPFRTWQTIHSCLNPYIQKVKKSYGFRELQAIMDKFIPGDYEKDVPLNGSFLIGYYHERAYIDSFTNVSDKNKNLNEKTGTEDSNE